MTDIPIRLNKSCNSYYLPNHLKVEEFDQMDH